MPVELVALTDTLAQTETSAWVEITPEQSFIDGDGRTHPAGQKTRGVYVDGVLKADDGAETPGALTVVASDATGNVPATVLYKIRRVLGSGTQKWTDVLLQAAVDTVALQDLEEVPGGDEVTVGIVTSVNGEGPDANGNVEIEAGGPHADADTFGVIKLTNELTGSADAPELTPPLVSYTVLFRNALA